jgi:acetylornithine deacetylase/succinyl-diaminopimelate desuccinylase-like protein
MNGKLAFVLLTNALLAASAVPTLAQKTVPQVAHDYVAARQPVLLQQFEDFLKIPNVAADPAGLKRNADYLVQQLQRRGVAAQLLTAPGLPSQTPPVVYGELKAAGATRTIVFYAHYDGQPVTASEWDTAPFSPTVRSSDGEERVYARGAGDDKAAIFAQLTALDAFGSAHLVPKANIRFVWEGEEEAGSVHLEQILDAHKDLIGGDIWLVCDGPVDQTRRQQLVFGARGDAHVQITLFGPKPALHSGHYGNWAPNPAMMMAQLLGGMKDANGHVLIPHFYDGVKPLGSLERSALAAAPVNDEMLRKEFGLGQTMGGGKHLLELLNEPSLEVAGISAGQTGSHATNSVPTRAVANLDLRLVVGNDAKVQQQRVVDYVRSQGFTIMTTEPSHNDLISHAKIAWIETPPGENASRTPMDLPIAKDVVAAVEGARGKTILLPTSGGTVPLDAMQRASGSPTIMVPIANHDDNQHAANENLRLKNLWDGIETMAALMAMP